MRFASEASTREDRGLCSPLLELLHASQSCELTCRRAADRVNQSSLSRVLLRQAHERARFSREIDTELTSLGVEPPSGRDSGDHRLEPWGVRDEEKVGHCVRAHVELLAAYDRARSVALPRDVEAVFARQRQAIARGLSHLQSLVGQRIAI